MATSAKTSFSVNQTELRTIAASLELYEEVMRNVAHGKPVFEDVTIGCFLEDPRKHCMVTQKLRRDLGFIDAGL